MSLDLARSRRFPVSAPTYSLRPLLRAPDPEALATSISQALQVRGFNACVHVHVAGVLHKVESTQMPAGDGKP